MLSNGLAFIVLLNVLNDTLGVPLQPVQPGHQVPVQPQPGQPVQAVKFVTHALAGEATQPVEGAVATTRMPVMFAQDIPIRLMALVVVHNE